MYQHYGIYNVLDFATTPAQTWEPNVSTGTTPATNLASLQAAITAAQAGGGGIVLVPCQAADGTVGSFFLSGTITIDSNSVASPISVVGYGGATNLLKIDDTDLFYIYNSMTDPGKNEQGMIFENLFLQFSNADPTAVHSAFNISDAPNVLLRRIYFGDYPNAVIVTNCFQFTMVDCRINYGSGFMNSSATIGLQILGSGGPSSGCSEVFVGQCVFNNSAPTLHSITAMVIQESTHGHFTDNSFNGFTTSINLNPPAAGNGANYHTFTNCSINPTGSTSLYGALIQPDTASPGQVTFIKFVGCLFSTNVTESPLTGVRIDENGGTVEHVQFDGCSFDGFPGPGLWATSGNHFTVTGCNFFNNASYAVEIPIGQIAFDGPAAGVVISGCSVVNGSQWGIALTGGVSTVAISGCDLTNNTDGAITASSLGLAVTVRGCEGYNGAHTPVLSGPPLSSVVNSAAKNGYFGPSILSCVSAITNLAVTLNGEPFAVADAGFFSIFLNSPYDTVQFNHPPLGNFTWIGE